MRSLQGQIFIVCSQDCDAFAASQAGRQQSHDKSFTFLHHLHDAFDRTLNGDVLVHLDNLRDRKLSVPTVQRKVDSSCRTRRACELDLLDNPLNVHLPGVRLLDNALHRDLQRGSSTAQSGLGAAAPPAPARRWAPRHPAAGRPVIQPRKHRFIRGGRPA